MAYALYSTAKLSHSDVGRYTGIGHLIRRTGAVEDEKAVVFLHPERAGQIVREMPLRAILVPNVEDRDDTTFTPVDPSTVRQAASFTTMSQLPYVGRHTHDFFVELCSRLPGFRVNLGRDRAKIGPAIAGFLAGGATRQSVSVSAMRPGPVERVSPLVSVVIPVFNGAKFLGEAVDNVLAQQYASTEIIVVDDGSTDDTEEVASRLPCDVRYIRQENFGPASARNRGIRDTSGDLIAFLDVDDLWPEHTLRRMVDEALADPSLDVVRGYAQPVEQDDRDGALLNREDPKRAFPDYIGAALYRKHVFSTVGLFDDELIYGEDADWFNRAREAGVSMKRLDAVTLHVRRHGENMTEGKNLLELNLLRVVKKAMDRKRSVSRAADIRCAPGVRVTRQPDTADPLVSVVVPVYNGEAYLGQALDSIFSQTYRALDVIVVDDGSTDGTADTAGRYGDRVTLMQQANAGPASARNSGILRARGELLAFLDADDVWLPDKLRTQVDYLAAHPESMCVATRIRHIVESDAAEYVRHREDWLEGSQASRLFSALLIRRSLFDLVGLLDPKFRFGEDVDWLARLDNHHVSVDPIDQVLVRKRVHRDNVSNLAKPMHTDTLRALRQAIRRRRQKTAGDRDTPTARVTQG